MITEVTERRVLAALRFVSSVTQLPVTGPFDVRLLAISGVQLPELPIAVPPLQAMSNGRGLVVIHQAPGFAIYTGDLNLAAPAVRTLQLRASDRSGGFLPAEFSVDLPRAVNSARLANGHFSAGSVFEPVVIPLLPSPRSPEAANWAVIRVHLRHAVETAPASGIFVPVPSRGALIRIHAEEQPPRRLLGRGLTEWRPVPGLGHPAVAEALVAVPDVPVTQWSNLPNANVLTPNQEIRIEVRIDRNFNPSTPEAMPNLARLEPPGNVPLPNGVVMAEFPAAGQPARQLRAGLRETLSLFLDQNAALSTP